MPKITRSEEIEAELKVRKVKRGLKVLAGISLVAGVYGYKLGRNTGYTKGVKDGYVTASNEMLTAFRELTVELVNARKEE